ATKCSRKPSATSHRSRLRTDCELRSTGKLRRAVSARASEMSKSAAGPGAVLVTGGAGYIGSHTALKLRETGREVLVLDDLSRGFRQAVRGAPLVVGDIGDVSLVSSVLREYQ